MFEYYVITFRSYSGNMEMIIKVHAVKVRDEWDAVSRAEKVMATPGMWSLISIDTE